VSATAYGRTQRGFDAGAVWARAFRADRKCQAGHLIADDARYLLVMGPERTERWCCTCAVVRGLAVELPAAQA
jgi:hypothetical protein